MGIPDDADKRRAVKPVICYPAEGLPVPDMALYQAARLGAVKVSEVLVPPRSRPVRAGIVRQSIPRMRRYVIRYWSRCFSPLTGRWAHGPRPRATGIAAGMGDKRFHASGGDICGTKMRVIGVYSEAD